MNKGFVQTSSLIFSVVFIVMLLAAGYLYFFNGYKETVSSVIQTSLGSGAKLRFVHPVYQYSLDLPIGWKEKYQVREEGNQTSFWHLGQADAPDLLFSVKHQPVGEIIPLSGDSRKLAEADGFSYLLIVPEKTAEALLVADSQIKQEISSVGKTFSLLNKNQNESEITKVLIGSPTASSSPIIKFSAFEIIATQENASTTEYFIWFLRREFTWSGFSLNTRPIESHPAVVTIVKDNDNLVSIKLPRAGVNYKNDFKKLFPLSIRDSAVFTEKSAEHEVMIEKLSSQLNEMFSAYFGVEPISSESSPQN